MGLDRKAEEVTRTMLGHATRGEPEDLAAALRSVANELFLGSLPLYLFTSAYIAIDVAGRWPTDADLHQIANAASQAATELDISEEEIYEYLSRVALGSEDLDDVFTDEGLVTIPLYTTANLLLAFAPREKHWWEYLDQIWDAAETADRTSLSVLPALMLRAHREESAS